MVNKRSNSTRVRDLRKRFWLETVLASVGVFLGVLTLVWKDWIEAFGFDPDNHSGSLEWLIAGGFIAASLILAVLAKLEWRKAAPTVTTP
jgi:DMSO/TMAO reductase YedYZ heme-binding membrane subunit